MSGEAQSAYRKGEARRQGPRHDRQRRLGLPDHGLSRHRPRRHRPRDRHQAGLHGGLTSIAGGNISEYAAVCEAARHDAYLQMAAHAEHLGAHAVIAVRYDATEFMQGSTEVLAYGTAVTLERPHG